MLTVVVIIFSILIFPIYLSVDLRLSKKEKKIFFKLKLFFIKIIRGYAEIINEGIIFHLTKTKAIIIPFNKIFDMRKSVEPLKDYHFIKIKTRLDVGSDYSLLPPLLTGFILEYIYNILKWLIYYRKPYVKLDNEIRIFEEESLFELYFNASVIFNLLMVLLSFVKILVGKITYASK